MILIIFAKLSKVSGNYVCMQLRKRFPVWNRCCSVFNRLLKELFYQVLKIRHQVWGLVFVLSSVMSSQKCNSIGHNRRFFVRPWNCIAFQVWGTLAHIYSTVANQLRPVLRPFLGSNCGRFCGAPYIAIVLEKTALQFLRLHRRIGECHAFPTEEKILFQI